MTSQFTQQNVDVLIIGAGPSGTMAACLLQQQGIKVLVVEKQTFPRFSIGESLLPQSMEFLEKADMLAAFEDDKFQFKNGAAFRCGDQYTEFNFTEKFSPGPGTTYQVQRANFDKNLADIAQKKGVEIRFQHEVLNVTPDSKTPNATIKSAQGQLYQVNAKFILDASGFGRVLPRLLDLEYPSDFPIRKSVFCHIQDNIDDNTFDRNKILVTVHPSHKDVWFWSIPFANGTCSLGVVAEPHVIDQLEGSSQDKLFALIGQTPTLAHLLTNAKVITPVQEITGYSANVKSLHGDGYALLGNAGEFLDPVFSSGVTIAFKSADMAAQLVCQHLAGLPVNWQTDYAEPLKKGVDTFRTFVNAWYDTRFQDIIFFEQASSEVRAMICSILAGYAWDTNNPYVAQSERRLGVLAEICKAN
ncbi:MAG: NAD(P)/FAD-dependent oxidoreductase [Kangiellaceae bacterium]|nr:NAD(P)/FAD-dependent oxidoreductase [Kangiellaceae bacterium]